MASDLFESIRQEILKSMPYDRTCRELQSELQAMRLDTLLVYFLNWVERLVHPRPRNVYVSRELSLRSMSESDGIELKDTLKRIEVGADLYPQLGTWLVHGYVGKKAGKKNLRASRHLDLLLHDWNIHHIHLSEKRNKNSVLFVIFNPEDAFVLDLLPHGQWENSDLVEVAVRNWPDQELFCELKGVLAPQERMSSQDRRRLRSAGISAPVQIGQRLFLGRSGGITSAGTSSRASLRAMRLRRTICEAALKLEENGDAYEEAFVRAKRGIPRPPQFSVKFCRTQFGYGFCLFEQRTEVAIPLEREISA